MFLNYKPPMKTVVSALILWFACLQILSAQEYLSKESLLGQLNDMEQDTNRVLLYISIGQQYENNLPDSAIYYYLQARDLSEQLGYNTGILKYYSNITYVYNSQGKYDEALSLNLQSVELAKELWNAHYNWQHVWGMWPVHIFILKGMSLPLTIFFRQMK